MMSCNLLNTLPYRLIGYIIFIGKIYPRNLWAASEDDLYFFLLNCLRYRLTSINDNNAHDFKVAPVVSLLKQKWALLKSDGAIEKKLFSY